MGAVRWERQYAVLTRHSGIHLYESEAAYNSGENAIAHMDLANGELRVPREDDSEVNWNQPRLILELINVCTTSFAPAAQKGAEPLLTKEIRLVSLKIDTDQPVLEKHAEFQRWEHHLNRCMRVHGKVDAVLKVANRLGSAVLSQHHNTSDGASMSQKSTAGITQSYSEGSLGLGFGTEQSAFDDGLSMSTVAVGHKKATWTNQAFKPRWH